jgi:hypothetical protein
MAPLLWRYLNRFGKDGVVFEDIVFNNATIQIDMGEKDRGHTRVEYKKSLRHKKKRKLIE